MTVPYAEKQAVIRQYRTVRGFRDSRYLEDTEIKTIKEQIAKLETNITKIRDSRYSEDTKYNQETERRILDYMNGKTKTLE